jgi:hypothetical protein
MAFARHFKQDSLADVDLVIKCLGQQEQGLPPPKRARHDTPAAAAAATAEAAADDDESEDGCPDTAEALQLAAFPAHRLILFTSEYFEVQVSALKAAPSPVLQQLCQHWCAVRLTQHIVHHIQQAGRCC